MSLPGILQLIGGLSAAGLIIGSLIFFILKGMKSTAIESYREDNQALRARQETLIEENRELKNEQQLQQKEIAALKEALRALTEQVAGVEALIALNTKVDTLDKKVDTNHKEVLGIVKAQAQALGIRLMREVDKNDE